MEEIKRNEQESGEIPVEETADAAERRDETEAEETEETSTRKDRKGSAADAKKLRAENADLRAKLEQAMAEAEEQKGKYLRTLAEYDNYRKRTAKEREGIYADAAADCVTNLLPLFDNLGRASQYTESDKVAEGVKMILNTVPDVLTKMNIEAYGVPGDTFDPNIHNAVMHVDDEQYGEGEILEVFQC